MHKQMEGKTNQEILDFLTKYISLEEFERSGRLVWMHREETSSGSRDFNKKHAGKSLDETSPTVNGYRRTTIKGVKFYAHHIAYFLKTRELWDEDLEIDHINRFRIDNHPENLRAVSKSENSLNRGSSVKIAQAVQRQQDVTEFLTTHGSVETVPMGNIVTYCEDHFRPIVYRTIDRDHVADLKKHITEETNGKLKDPLLGVRVKGDCKVYLADGSHRLIALNELGHKSAQMKVYEVEDFEEVEAAGNEIKAVNVSAPKKTTEDNQRRQAVYTRMASDAVFRGQSNTEISKRNRINQRTVAKMKKVIEYLRGQGKEPDKWWKDRLILKGDLITDPPMDVCQEKAAKRTGKAQGQNEQIEFFKENPIARAIYFNGLGFSFREVLKTVPIMKGIEEGLITTGMDKFERMDVIETMAKSIEPETKPVGLWGHFEEVETTGNEFDPIMKRKRLDLDGLSRLT